MNRYQMAIIGGAVAAIAGLTLLVGMVDTPRLYTNFTVPAGVDNFHAIPVSMPDGGFLHFQFTELDGGSVDGYIFDEPQFSNYRTSGSTVAVHAMSGDRRSTTVQVSRPGMYFLVIDHGSGFENGDQRVSVIYRASALNPLLTAVSVVAIVGGSITAGIGYWTAKRVIDEARRAGVLSEPSDVYFFDRRRPP